MKADIVLDDAEVRILGCLMEKEITTPEYYPLSMNALTNACNQKSNRDPIVSYDESGVARGVDSLQKKDLVRKTHVPGSRVPKYLHTILDRFDLSRQAIAILCELMLRGPQTVGELRTRTERMSAFEDLDAVEKTLEALMAHDPPLAAKLPREAGRKECRYVHFFSGGTGVQRTAHDVSPGTPANIPLPERISRLEEEVARLGTGLEELKQAFSEFKSQF